MPVRRGGLWAVWLALALLAVALVAVLASARANPAADGCGTLPELLGYLAGEHHERLIGHGVLGNGVPVLLVMSEAGTWTLVVAQPDGRACMGAAGWRAEPLRDEGT